MLAFMSYLQVENGNHHSQTYNLSEKINRSFSGIKSYKQYVQSGVQDTSAVTFRQTPTAET